MRERAIGIFDSGLGGLTVLREIERLLPEESLIYFGDTARVPYGNKSAETIERYALENASFLLEKNVKALVVACNTASAYGVEAMRRTFQIPIIEVINPGAEAVVAATRTKRVAVLGTKATIASEAYPKAIHAIDPSVSVLSIACPLLTPLIEEGMIEHAATRLMVKEYLAGMKGEGCDAVLLGCTHYPLIRNLIEEELGAHVAVVDSAIAASRALGEVLDALDLRNGGEKRVDFFVSDDPTRFQRAGEGFLQRSITEVNRA